MYKRRYTYKKANPERYSDTGYVEEKETKPKKKSILFGDTEDLISKMREQYGL